MEATDTVRVLVVDDHEVLASALAQALDAEPDIVAVGVAGTLERAATMIPTTTPDVLLLDHRLPDGDGVDAVQRLRDLRPSMAVVILMLPKTSKNLRMSVSPRTPARTNSSRAS